MKYFYYISQSKVEMLKAQVRKRRFTVSSISSKLGYGPASVTVAAEKESGTLVADTLHLLKALEKRGSVKQSESLNELNVSHFYHDEGLWKAGLFTFDSMCQKPTVIYALWRPLGQALVLLVGSPNNILGEKVVAGDCVIPGTSGAHLAILKYVDTILHSDEPNAVRIWGAETYGKKLRVPEPSNSSITFPKVRRRAFNRNDSLAFDPKERGLTLGMLCLRQLNVLPELSLEVMFRVFSTHDISKEQDIKRFGWWSEDPVADTRKTGLLKYDRVYFGSPVYTALL